MRWFWRYILPVLGIAFCVAVFYWLILIQELGFLANHVVPPHGDELPDWLDAFRQAEIRWVLFPSMLLAVVWSVVSVLKPSFRGDQRSVWCILWALAFVFALLGLVFWVPPEENGVGLIPSGVTLFNGLILFWLATAPFSTVTHKFAPIGAAWRKKAW